MPRKPKGSSARLVTGCRVEERALIEVISQSKDGDSARKVDVGVVQRYVPRKRVVSRKIKEQAEESNDDLDDSRDENREIPLKGNITFSVIEQAVVAELPPLIDDVPLAKKKRILVKVPHSTTTTPDHPLEVPYSHEVEPHVRVVAVVKSNRAVICSTPSKGSMMATNKEPNSLPSTEESTQKKGLKKGKETSGIFKSQGMYSSDEMERAYIEFLEKINYIIFPSLNKVCAETGETDQALGTTVDWKSGEIKELSNERNRALKRRKKDEETVQSFTAKRAKLDDHKDQLEQKVTALNKNMKRLLEKKAEALKDKGINIDNAQLLKRIMVKKLNDVLKVKLDSTEKYVRVLQSQSNIFFKDLQVKEDLLRYAKVDRDNAEERRDTALADLQFVKKTSNHTRKE
ncbi:hypothetical protein J5N97_029964 [Dioscorea zingiberensis]|uniref:Uncharacterized protein n=1 Tax=Dioscorea zingiberensis TaxID=325984 RepID=A0A9D5BWN2_9LILI|nr:hypothetical protein J5N97_029964 [Dioscorea zingiberensis]